MEKESPARIYGVLGFPAKHSLSPAMHNAAFRALKINAEYKIFEIEPEQLDYFLDNINKNNIYGLNICVKKKYKKPLKIKSSFGEALKRITGV